MKKSILFVMALGMAFAVNAQSIIETVATVGSLTVPACSVSLEKDSKIVQSAMNQYLKDLKLKTSKEEGYVVALNAFVENISTSPINLYTKVEEQGKKKNRVTVVTASAISTDLTIDQQTLRGNVRNWLASFVDYIGRYEAQQQMLAQQDNLKRAEKAADKAAAGVAAIDKSIAKDQKKIADKQKEIKKLQDKIKDLEKEIAALEKNIQKTGGKREEAERKANDAARDVNAAQDEVDRYRQLSE